jgi:rhodanese-related sulfurtransferase
MRPGHREREQETRDMARQRRRTQRASKAVHDGRTRATREAPSPSRGRLPLIGAIVGGVALVAVVAVVGLGALGGSGAPSPTAAAGATASGSPATGTVVQARGGHWTNITPDTLAAMMGSKDFTLLNVKTPYIGEIDGTDLYIPYDQLTARQAQLPADKSARIVVYCRTGNESAIAAQTLLDLGYTDIWNLDGGMTAWTASGRPLVQKART